MSAKQFYEMAIDAVPALIAEVERLRAVLPPPQQTARFAMLLPPGVDDLEAKNLETGAILSDADSYQWVKAVDVAPAPPPTEPLLEKWRSVAEGLEREVEEQGKLHSDRRAYCEGKARAIRWCIDELAAACRVPPAQKP